MKPLFLLLGVSCAAASEAELRKLLGVKTGRIALPAGTHTLKRALVVDGKDILLTGSAPGTTLRASRSFEGEALIVVRGGTDIRIRDLTFDGNRMALEKPMEIAPSNETFAKFYPNNGILATGVDGLELGNVRLRSIANFAILVSQSKRVRINRANVLNSGSRDKNGRNNTSGGILIEEGTVDFEVKFSKIRNVRGNGIWTHSNYGSPRNRRGLITENEIGYVARDAIQIGHATGVEVSKNFISMVGYPNALVDHENGGTPVGIDTAGNVDATTYAHNRLEEMNGKCFDLDGFHHGDVHHNTCVNKKRGNEYPYGHFAIVMNNNNPDMKPEDVVIEDNEFDGMKFGGVFLIGRDNIVRRNHFFRLNTAGCNESHGKVPCFYSLQEPDMLQSGIYIARGIGRMETTVGNIVEDNIIGGHRMKERCIAWAPGVDAKANTVRRNTCLNAPVGTKK